tara:strand:+ start:86297 stop:86917 length:621 start_codon:yes stop_codon:yes gene_type:complete
MKTFFYIFIIFSFSILRAQKVVEKTIIDSKDTSVLIDANNCFAVTIKTAKTNQIKVEAKMAGEYGKDLVLNIHEEGSTLLVDTSFNPNFELPNDKLGAHKVLSISLIIILPEHLNVTLYGTFANVNASGVYENIDVALNDGRCTLMNVSESANVYTQSGTIEVYAKAAKIDAISSYGEVVSEEIPKGNASFNLKTITGNIHIYKTD